MELPFTKESNQHEKMPDDSASADDAAEWWDEQSEEEYNNYDDYISECGYDIEEISEEEYRRDYGKE